MVSLSVVALFALPQADSLKLCELEPLLRLAERPPPRDRCDTAVNTEAQLRRFANTSLFPLDVAILGRSSCFS